MDVVGEAFDKVSKVLSLPYSGGPSVSAAATLGYPNAYKLLKLNVSTGSYDFSFSGLKTAVRYAIQDKDLSEDDISAICRDFEDVVTQVLIKKTTAAIEECDAQTLIVGGGVSANRYIKQEVEKSLLETHPEVTAYFPQPGLSTDNSVMIALAGHARAQSALSTEGSLDIRADGNRSLA